MNRGFQSRWERRGRTPVFFRRHDPRHPGDGFPWGVGGGSVRWGVVLCVMGLAGGGQRAAGQSPAPDSGRSPHPAAGLPPSLVTLGFPGVKPIDWQQYPLPEDCQHYVSRELRMAKNTAMRPLLRHRSNDTIPTVDPWMVLSPAVVQATHACLARNRVADLPPFALLVARQLAVEVQDDALWQAIVARQLGALPATAVTARADLLLALIGDLMGVATPAHVQLARTYMAQLDAFGPTAIQQQLDASSARLRLQSKVYATDMEREIAIREEQIRLFKQPGVAALPEYRKVIQNLTVQQRKILDREAEITQLRFHQYFSLDTLASLVVKLRKLYGPLGVGMANTPAPPLHCDYYFPTPQTTTPVAGPMPTLPAKGTFSVILFDDGQDNGGGNSSLARQFHAAAPQLAIIMVSHTTAGFAGHFLVSQPEQEAVLQHQYLADSLGTPGAFCVTATHYHMTAEGRAIPSPDPNTEVYQDHETNKFLVSPMGLILNGGFAQFGIEDLPRFEHIYMEQVGAGTPNSGQP